MTKNITVTVSGTTATGKTFIVELLTQFLRNMEIDTTIDYGPDGDPRRTQEDRAEIYDRIRDELKVTVVEKMVARELTSKQNTEAQ